MSVLWTDFGNKALLSKAFDAVPLTTFQPVFGVLLEGPPPMDRSKVYFLDYPYTFTRTDFFAFVVYPSQPHTLQLGGGRAVLQWGPPAMSLNVVSAFTAYGIIWCSDAFDVCWVDKWDTPHEYAVGDIVRILPWVTMTSECPPLGGCT
jgi:hypothetical protein